MVLNEIIEQAGRQSRASEQNGMTYTTHTFNNIDAKDNAVSALYFILSTFDVYLALQQTYNIISKVKETILHEH